MMETLYWTSSPIKNLRKAQRNLSSSLKILKGKAAQTKKSPNRGQKTIPNQEAVVAAVAVARPKVHKVLI